MYIKAVDDITEYIKSRHNFDLSKYDPSFVTQILVKRMKINGSDTQENYYTALIGNEYEAMCLIDSCSVLYSCFFRNPLVFMMLEQWLLPEMIASLPSGSEIRVWSSGCAQGQEAYSAAIILSELRSCGIKDFKYRIFATDISSQAIEAAKKGVYDIDTLRNIRYSLLMKYFINEKGRYSISQEIRDTVSFSFYDMLDETTDIPEQSIYGDFDIVFCSNLLIYYNKETRKRMISKLLGSMSGSGCLIADDCEKAIFDKIRYLKPAYPNTPLYKIIKIGA